MSEASLAVLETDTLPAEDLSDSSTQAIFISFHRHKLSRVKQNNEIMSFIYSHRHARLAHRRKANKTDLISGTSVHGSKFLGYALDYVGTLLLNNGS